MGWLTEARTSAPQNLWGMNEAEVEPAPDADPPLIGWFQVDVTGQVGADGLLPLEPFLACVGDVVGRLGTFELQAARMLLPPPDLSVAHPLGPDALGHFAETAGWFANCDRRHGTSVQFAIDGGQAPTIATAASEIFRLTNYLVQDVFRCDRFDTSDDSSMTLPGVGDEQWAGPSRYRATFSGELVEWSLDALAWAAAFLAHGCYRSGVESPVVLTATRTADSAASP